MSKIDEILKRNFLTKEEVYEYLYNLRESGTVNMFGATSYLQDFFDLSKIDARELLLDWMNNFKK